MSNKIWVCRHCGNRVNTFLDPVFCNCCGNSYCFDHKTEGGGGDFSIVNWMFELFGALIAAVIFAAGWLLWKLVPYLWRGLKKLAVYLWSKVQGFRQKEEQVNQ